MPDIEFSSLTIPTPEPYDKNDTEKQRENLSYVVMQIIQIMKDSGMTISFPTGTVGNSNAIMEEIRDAVKDLMFNGQEIDLGIIKITLVGKTLAIEE